MRLTYYERNKEKVKAYILVKKDKIKARKYEYKKRMRPLAKQWISSYLDNHHCELCGERDQSCLQFHHKDKTTKKYNIAILVNEGPTIQRLQKEIEKCQVLCGNCHMIIHHMQIKRKPYVELSRKRKERRRFIDFLETYKKNNRCKQCAMNDTRCLVFHHIDPKTKEYSINKIRTWNRIHKELPKCEVLCVNCHEKIHH